MNCRYFNVGDIKIIIMLHVMLLTEKIKIVRGFCSLGKHFQEKI